MNKKITVLVILFLVFSVSLFSADKRQDLYLQAVSEKSPELKVQLLKEYLQAYENDKNDKFMRFVVLNLADTTFKLKLYNETIQYGEKALEYTEIDETNKLRIVLFLANSYLAIKIEPAKGIKYAESTIEIANQIITKTTVDEPDKEKAQQFINTYKAGFIAPAYRIQAGIHYNNGEIKLAAEKALEAYKTDHSENSSQMALSLAGNLFKKGKLEDAIAITEQIINKEKPKYQYANFLASAYYKQGNKDKAVTYFELAYKAKRSTDLGMKIGILINRKEPLKAIEYFADVFVMSNLNKESEAYKYLEQLYFNQVAKDKTHEEKEEGFKEIIAAATARVSSETEKETSTETTETTENPETAAEESSSQN